MNPTNQLCVPVPTNLARRCKANAALRGVTLKTYTIQAFQNFLSKPTESRRVYFSEPKAKRKTGRKIAA